MKPNSFLLSAGYLVAALLVVVPIFETVASVFPLQLGDVTWRFGAVGLVTQALLTPVLGMTLTVYLASWHGSRTDLLVLAGLCTFAMIGLLAAFPVFVMDALEMRMLVEGDAQRAVDLATAVAAGKLLAFALVAALLAWGSRSTAKKSRAAVKSEEGPLILNMET
jgi:Na+/phosphate symporter